MAAQKKSLSRDCYTIGWIAPLNFELAAAIAMLDEIHDRPIDHDPSPNDHNTYQYGQLGHHDVVICCLPIGSYGVSNATAAAKSMLATFPGIKFGLLVGIGAGIPNENDDIRLGDVAISIPSGTSGGVIQYDFVKARGHTPKQWKLNGLLAKPPGVLLTAVNAMSAAHLLGENMISQYIDEAKKRRPKMVADFAYPGVELDQLFHHESVEDEDAGDLGYNDVERQILRTERESSQPVIHCGIIASGNAVVKDASYRDLIARLEEPGCICLEMEAAGLMDHFPCIVIRGISDYADLHKRDDWRKYAAMTAAACAKDLLNYVSPVEVSRQPNLASQLAGVVPAIQQLEGQMNNLFQRQTDEKRAEFLRKLGHDLQPFRDMKDRNPTRTPGTCEWFTRHDLFLRWKEEPSCKLLWVTLEPGRGKSVLSRYLIDEILALQGERTSEPNKILLCYFFFKDDYPNQSTAINALSSILIQIFQRRPDLLTDRLLSEAASHGSNFYQSVSSLWNALLSSTAVEHCGPVICVIDALDECQNPGRSELIKLLSEHALGTSSIKNPQLKFLVTSRPYLDIRRDFRIDDTLASWIHLKGDGKSELTDIAKEIDLVIDHEVPKLPGLAKEDSVKLTNFLKGIDNRTYLWVTLILAEIKKSPPSTLDGLDQILSEVGTSVNSVFEKILLKCSKNDQAITILQIILSAYRPQTVTEVSKALHLLKNNGNESIRIDQCLSEDQTWEMIRETCGLFVTNVDSRLYLIHQTAREFLVSHSMSEPNSRTNEESTVMGWRHSLSLPSAHSKMARICMLYLEHDKSPSVNDEFSTYCQHYLCAHLYEKQLDQEVIGMGKIRDLLDSKLHSFWDAIIENMPWFRSWNDEYRPHSQDDLLARVAYLGVPSMTRFLLKTKNHNVNGLTEAGWAPLHLAAVNGHVLVMHLLIEAGANVNILGKQSRTPIWAAIQSGSEKAVSRLLNERCSVDGQDKNQACAPLLCAIKMGNPEIVKMVLRKNAKTSFPAKGRRGLRSSVVLLPEAPMTVAIRSKRCDLVKLLLDAGTDPNADIRHIDDTIIAPVVLAIWKDEIDILKLLITHDANIKKALPIGVSDREYPLSIAAKANSLRICELLLKEDAEINVEHPERGTALQQAVFAWNYEIVEFLVSRGAAYNDRVGGSLPPRRPSLATDNNSRRHTTISSRSNDESQKSIAMRLFLYYHAGMDFGMCDTVMEMRPQILNLINNAQKNPTRANQYEQGQRLVYLAVDKGHYELAQGLTRRGRELQDLKSAELGILLTIAASSCDLALLLEVYKARGCNTNVRYPISGRTPLSLAMTFGRGDDELAKNVSEDESRSFRAIAKELLKRGADPNAKDNSGRTASDWAKQHNNSWYEELLAEHETSRQITRTQTNLSSSSSQEIAPERRPARKRRTQHSSREESLGWNMFG